MNTSKLENSHLIQVYSPTRTIWRGEDVSIVHLDVKVDKRFLQTDAFSYRLIPYVENYKTKTTFFDKTNGISLKFQENQNNNSANDRDIVASDGAVNVAANLYYKLTVSIDKDSFKKDDDIRVIVEACPLFDNPAYVISGASQVIS